MTHDMAELFALREHDHYGIHRRHLNEQMVRVLKAIGCDVGFCRGKGQYLYDRDGNRYLEFSLQKHCRADTFRLEHF